MQQKDKIKLRINDLNELEDILVNFGTRKKGVKKFISVHYAGLRNPVTALEVLNIGDVIRRGKITEEETKKREQNIVRALNAYGNELRKGQHEK